MTTDNLRFYDALHDPDCDDQHRYNAVYLHNYAACVVCGNPTREACVLCEQAHDHHCLFNLHLPELHEDNPVMIESEWGPERAEPDFEYGRVCLACYTKHENHPPFSWGWSTQRRVFAVAFDLFFHGGAAIQKGMSIPAGDHDSWVSDPHAAKLIGMYPWNSDGRIWPQDLDAFQLVSFLSWIGTWQDEIKKIAAEASKTLLRYHNKSLQAARDADRGFIDYSQDE